MRRALNLLLYLNAHWKPGDGGELELWAPDMSRCVRKVEPVFNRAVVFKTSLTSFHGHPEPLQAEERRSLAVYYYVPSMKAQAPPATPYAWAKGLARLLPNSRLLTFVGDGHTGQGRGNACIDDAVDAFYLHGTLPAKDLRCTA